MDKNCCIVVADGTRARFLTFVEAADTTTQSGTPLVEHEDLLNPEAHVKGRDLWSEAKSGRGRECGGTPAHGYDDHRDEHMDEVKRRFAARVVKEAFSLASAQGVERVIVAAEKQMLGFLRPALQAHEGDIAISEVAKDLTKLSPTELQERLAVEGLLPHRVPGTLRGSATS